MKIAYVVEHYAFVEFWSTPTGIKVALEKLGHEIVPFGYDPNNCDFTDLINAESTYDFILIFSCGSHPTLDNEIKRLKNSVNKKILLELGDEPQTYYANQNRILNVDAIFTPDVRCHNHYKSRGINSHWINHWGDELLFDFDPSIERFNRCITTCGDRGLEIFNEVLGDLFINKRILPEQNHEFYNSGTICLQKSRHNEITRRIFEAGGCKLAVVTDAITPDSQIFDLFEHGKDIFYYRNFEEAIEYIRLLLNDHNLRDTMSTNLFNKINEKHRAKNRALQLISIWEDMVLL